MSTLKFSNIKQLFTGETHFSDISIQSALNLESNIRDRYAKKQLKWKPKASWFINKAKSVPLEESAKNKKNKPKKGEFGHIQSSTVMSTKIIW